MSTIEKPGNTEARASIASKFRKIFRWILTLLLVILAVFIYMKYFFTYSEGYRAGLLQKFSHKGVIVKTYEGEMVLSSVSSNRDVAIASEKSSLQSTNRNLVRQFDTLQGFNDHCSLQAEEQRSILERRLSISCRQCENEALEPLHHFFQDSHNAAYKSSACKHFYYRAHSRPFCRCSSSRSSPLNKLVYFSPSPPSPFLPLFLRCLISLLLLNLFHLSTKYFVSAFAIQLPGCIYVPGQKTCLLRIFHPESVYPSGSPGCGALLLPEVLVFPFHSEP